MKKTLKIFIGAIIFFVVILIYSWFRTVIDKTNFLISFDKTFSLVIQEVWKFISIPTIFISLVILIVCWNFQDQIYDVLKNIKELKYKSLSAAFDFGDIKDSKSIQSTDLNTDNKIELLISLFGKNTTDTFLEIGGKILSPKEFIEIIKKNGLLTPKLEKDMHPMFSDGYYFGIFRSLITYFLHNLFDVELSEDKNQAKLKYKPKVQTLLEKRNKELRNS